MASALAVISTGANSIPVIFGSELTSRHFDWSEAERRNLIKKLKFANYGKYINSKAL